MSTSNPSYTQEFDREVTGIKHEMFQWDQPWRKMTPKELSYRNDRYLIAGWTRDFFPEYNVWVKVDVYLNDPEHDAPAAEVYIDGHYLDACDLPDLHDAVIFAIRDWCEECLDLD